MVKMYTQILCNVTQTEDQNTMNGKKKQNSRGQPRLPGNHPSQKSFIATIFGTELIQIKPQCILFFAPPLLPPQKPIIHYLEDHPS